MNAPLGSERPPSLATGGPDDRVDDVSIVARSAAEGSEVAPARARADRIKLLIDRMSDDRDEVLSLVTDAYEVRDWRALGYPSWKAYVTEEFGTALHRLGSDDRRDVVLLLNHTGMSTRAIAPVLGVGKSTVDRDAGRCPRWDTCRRRARDEGEDHDDRRLDDALAAIFKTTSTVPAVTGVDGKTYTRDRGASEAPREVPRPLPGCRLPD